jgi:hypothetical protein
MPRGIGREIGRRVLDRTDGRAGRVVVRLGEPVRTGEEEWACPYSISGIGLRGFRRSFGVDSLQSLMQAIEAVRATLAPHLSTLTWLNGEPGAFGKQLADRLEAYVERETLRHGAAVRRRRAQKRRRAERAG